MAQRLIPALWFAGVACTSPDFSDVLVYDYVGDGDHVVQPAPVGALDGLSPMTGALGAVTLGGRIVGEPSPTGETLLSWESGRPADLPYVVDDGTLVPTDDAGLVLSSFYHHLGEFRDDLAARGWSADMDAVFPVTTIAWTPEQLVGEALPVENAAYASNGLNVFILYEDGNQVVPLGAHAGVVRHEFGHAWFAVLAPRAAEGGFSRAGSAVFDDPRAANEGFADIVSVLSLDDPLAIPFLERDPRLDHSSEGYDYDASPYDFGVALSAFCWDMRLVTDDAPGTLERAVDALVAWYNGVMQNRLGGQSLNYAVTLHDAFAPVVDDDVLCERYRARFPNEQSRCVQ